jgi:hypothetical protein
LLQNKLNEEVKRIVPSPSVSVHWFWHKQQLTALFIGEVVGVYSQFIYVKCLWCISSQGGGYSQDFSQPFKVIFGLE